MGRGVKVFDGAKPRFLVIEVLDATRGVGYDQCMTTYQTLIDALDDDIARQTLRDMMIATAIYDIATLDYNDDDLDPSCADDDDDYAIMISHADRLHNDYQTLIADTHARDILTHLALATSLCPLHLCDYAICFDDLTPECAMIRLIHPTHDT